MRLESSLGVPLHRDGAFYEALVAAQTEPGEFFDVEIERPGPRLTSSNRR